MFTNAAVMDTLEAARGLEAAGLERKQADAVVRMVAAAVAAGRKDPVAKPDAAASRTDIANTGADLKKALAAAVDRMILNQILIGAALLAAMVLLSLL